MLVSGVRVIVSVWVSGVNVSVVCGISVSVWVSGVNVSVVCGISVNVSVWVTGVNVSVWVSGVNVSVVCGVSVNVSVVCGVSVNVSVVCGVRVNVSVVCGVRGAERGVAEPGHHVVRPSLPAGQRAQHHGAQHGQETVRWVPLHTLLCRL